MMPVPVQWVVAAKLLTKQKMSRDCLKTPAQPRTR